LIRDQARKIRWITVAIVPALTTGALAASPAAATTNPCGLVSRPAIARIVGLPHISTKVRRFSSAPLNGLCEIHVWSGNKPSNKQEGVSLSKGTLARVTISTWSGSPQESQASFDSRVKTMVPTAIPRGVRGTLLALAPLGAESARGSQVQVTNRPGVREVSGAWWTASQRAIIHLDVVASAKKTPVRLLKKIAVIAVPAFGL
jgi:hypothetical protein